MADKIITFPSHSSDPIKVFRNVNRPGVILRQGPSAVFLDMEVADQVIEAVGELLDAIEAQ